MTFPRMNKLAAFLACLLPATFALAETDAEREAMKFFENEVRPLLANRCYECHGEKKKKGSLRLDHISFITKGGDSLPTVRKIVSAGRRNRRAGRPPYPRILNNVLPP